MTIPREYLSVSTTAGRRHWRMIVAGLPVGADTLFRRDAERLWSTYWTNKGRSDKDIPLPTVWDGDNGLFGEMAYLCYRDEGEVAS